MRIKVCGLTQIDQVNSLASSGITFGGFIFYRKSPRYVLNHLTTEQVHKISNLNKVGVFVNASVEEVLQTVDACRLQAVQLHGNETPRYCEKVSNFITVIKAISIGNDSLFERYLPEYFDVADMYLFDTSSEAYGGTGKKFNWSLLSNLNIGKPFFLSGGIGPDDYDMIKDFGKAPVAKDLFAVDINSRFETSAGVKNIELIESFITKLNND